MARRKEAQLEGKKPTGDCPGQMAFDPNERSGLQGLDYFSGGGCNPTVSAREEASLLWLANLLSLALCAQILLFGA
jgi:hypothetical protein